MFLLTSMVGVVTGSNSLISVPVMFQFGIDPKVAVATNMFGLVFMAVGGTIPFIKKRTIDYAKISPYIVLTLISSAIGALLVGLVSSAGIKLIVSIAMISVAIFSLLRRNAGVGLEHKPIAHAVPIAWVLVFLLGIYGGVFSGGYTTILTSVCVGICGMQYTEAIASTKLINVFSSGIATIVFMWQGLVDYKLGLILGATMFVGAYAGAHFVTKLNDIWLRRIFLSTVILLALKTLYDFL
ncbi:MAG TPA: sulfite exporter TauE/SafE family protein [Pyrinomonadaceae bacterium]|nr:sulfite exporter TauE/SafE family protein [Pyrinomonadaceae bacterium]